MISLKGNDVFQQKYDFQKTDPSLALLLLNLNQILKNYSKNFIRTHKKYDSTKP